MFLTVFGSVWYAFAALVGSPNIQVALGSAVLGIIIVGILLRATRQLHARDQELLSNVASNESESLESQGDMKWFYIINGVQWAAIVVAIVAANMLHAPQAIVSLIAIIVGLHFLPLALFFKQPIYYITAGVMCAAGAASFALSGTAAPFVAAAGSCLSLWATAALVLFAAHR